MTGSSRLSRDQATSRLVAAAADILAAEGPGAVKARTVAQAASVSTSAVYHHVGGIPELFQAVADRGFEELAEKFSAVPRTDDPVADLFRHALAARGFAMASPHLYDLMFGLSTRGTYRPTAANEPDRRSASFRLAYGHLRSVCERVHDAGRVRATTDVTSVADQLWAAVHGFVTLELAGHFVQHLDPVREVLTPMTVNILVGEGDSRASAQASHAQVMLCDAGDGDQRENADSSATNLS
ncbi:WHG domain-containing protein [Gordonia sp. TBRC 11910]|uniref:WHG domain-containing protein n=1 Tax=Gordonia asplenii TaxID=2725283 RepID=A0A848KVN9_9ACTN|nr:TetR-like C-terminal domain-containing protein [Gordonia asplenii]NMO02736.1 WHG domain-containing protein [Gordonia asplenii]